MAVTPIRGAVPITQFTPAQQTQLRAGQAVGNFQVLNGHVMDLRTTQGQALVKQRQANSAAATPSAAPAPTPATSGATGLPKGGWMDLGSGGVVQPPPQAAPDPAAADKDAASRDALARIKDVLGQYGLSSLADFAWRELVSGRSETEVLQDLRETQQFKDRFPAIAARQAKGLPALSPAEYISYENTATQMMRAAGIPSGFYDTPDDFTKFLANDVSVKELSDRVDLARQAAYQAPTEVRSALRQQFGLGDGDLAAYFLDPNRATPLLQRTYNAATIAGASSRTGFQTNAEQDYRLADLGVSADQAQAGFNALGQQKGLFDPLLGHNEGQITVDEQLGAAFGGNVAATQRIEQRRQTRVAEFGGGGSFAAGQGGISGIGRAT